MAPRRICRVREGHDATPLSMVSELVGRERRPTGWGRAGPWQARRSPVRG